MTHESCSDRDESRGGLQLDPTHSATCDGDLVMGEEESALADGMQLVHEVDDSGSFSHVTEDRITVTAELITQDLQAKNGSGHSVRVGVP